MHIRSIVKKNVLGGIDLLPFGRDIYLQLSRKMLDISYRGVFKNFEDAKRAIPSSKKNNYDVVNKNKAESLDGSFTAVEVNDYNGMVAEMKYHAGVTAFNLDYLAYLQPTVC